jgi:Trypsin-like peptidase domain
MDPRDVIVPIFAMEGTGNVRAFLGTGSFVGPRSYLLTADHVVRNCDYEIAITTMHDVKILYPATVIERDEQHDLALLEVPGYRPANPLAVRFDVQPSTNQSLLTFDYGTTISAGRNIHLAPATRIGHMTRMLDLRGHYGPAGVSALELSFPALRGASGAPVMTNDAEFRVCGVVVANVAYHLLPAQIETVLDNSNTLLEETRYMLPQAAAVNIIHLKPMYERLLATREQITSTVSSEGSAKTESPSESTEAKGTPEA